jgi:hypothetical protein
VRGPPRLEGNRLMASQFHSDQSAAGSPDGAERPEPSRRSVLYGAAGLAGAGLAATAIASTLAIPAVAAEPAPRSGAGGSAAEPVIVHIRDVQSGDMDVFAGETKARLRDPALAAKLARANDKPVR